MLFIDEAIAGLTRMMFETTNMQSCVKGWGCHMKKKKAELLLTFTNTLEMNILYRFLNTQIF